MYEPDYRDVLMKDSKTYMWYKIKVRAINERLNDRIGFTVVDIDPIDGEFPEFFYPATIGVVKKLLKSNK